jgi:outer membrane receptor protein involved in Fe transport
MKAHRFFSVPSGAALAVTGFLALQLFQAALMGQTTAGSVVGRIVDSQGLAVPSVEVELLNEGTHARIVEHTNGEGGYVFSNVAPGSYQVSVKASGFQRERAEHLTVDLLQTLRQDFTLAVESTTESVTVTAASPIIQTENQTLSMLIDSKQIEETPLNGRTDVYGLMGLAPGLQRANSNALIAGSSFTGGTTMTIDGMNMMDLFNSRMAGTPPSLEDIAEFTVVTNNAAAEFGRGGAQIVLQTKAGTNEFHGSLFEFNRNVATTARNFFLSPTTKNPPYNRNEFGGSFGGPVKKNKLFFFTSLEDLRAVTSKVVNSAMPPTPFLTGNFTAYPQYIVNDPSNSAPFPGNQVPVTRISSISEKFLSYFSPPNIPTSNTLGTNFTTVLPTFQKEFRFSTRGDYTPTANDRVMFRWFVNNNGPYYSGSGGSSALFGSYAGTGTRTWNIASNWTHIFSPTIVNELSGGFNQEQDPRLDQNDNVDPGSLVPGIPSPPAGHGGLPTIAVSNLASITSAGSNFHNIHYITQLNDNLSITHGKHTFKTGGQFLQQRTGQGGVNLGSFTFDGRYTRLNTGSVNAVNAFADFLLGDMYTDSAATSTSESRTRGDSMGLYAQDSWQITPNLTLNLGLRWEKSFVLTRTYAGAANFYPNLNGGELVTLTGTPNPLLSGLYPYVTGSSIGINLSNYTHTPNTNFGPRIGFAYRPFGSSKFVIRGGYAMIYDYYPSYMNGLFQLPFYAVLTYNAAAGATPTLSFANPFPTNTISKGYPSLTAVPLNLPTPYQEQWTLSTEYEFLHNTALRISYLGNVGVHLYIPYNINDPGQVVVPSGGSIQTYRQFPIWGSIAEQDFSSNTNMNQLQVGVRRRFSHLTFDFEYSWTHALGIDGANDGAPSNPFNLRYDYGNLDFYKHQYLVINNTYELPFGTGRLSAGKIGNALIRGWRFSGLFTAMSGQPISVTFSPTLTGWEGSRANTVPGVDPYANQTIQHWFNLAAFKTPAPYTFGDSARNAYYGPGYWELDASVIRQISIGERIKLDIRTDAFNLTNHTDFSTPAVSISNAATFGQITSTANSARQLEFSARLKF